MLNLFKDLNLSVLHKIINSDDESLIRDINAVIIGRDFDWFAELSENQQNDVLQGINQLDNGDFFTHEEAKKRFGTE